MSRKKKSCVYIYLKKLGFFFFTMSNLFITFSDTNLRGYEITLQITDKTYRNVTRTEHFSPFKANFNELINFLDPILQTLIDDHSVESVYTFGDHRFLRYLNSLSTFGQIIDIRDSRINQNRIIYLDSPYSNYFIGCEDYPQHRGTKILTDDVSESINNLCFLIAKNIVIGYDLENECMVFNVKKQFPKFCTTHSFISSNRCTIILSEMNIFRFSVLNWARELLYKLNGKHELVEFILQCVLLNLAFPETVKYSFSSRTYFDIYISDTLVMSVMRCGWWLHSEFRETYIKLIRENISTFSIDVLKLDKVDHRDCSPIDGQGKIMDNSYLAF